MRTRKPRTEPSPTVEAVLVDSVLPDHLSAIVSRIEDILKPYQRKIRVTVDKTNSLVEAIGIEITIHNPR